MVSQKGAVLVVVSTQFNLTLFTGFQLSLEMAFLPTLLARSGFLLPLFCTCQFGSSLERMSAK